MGKIVVTGAAGFIGSCLVKKLNKEGYTDLVLVDDFSKTEKKENYETKKYSELVERSHFFTWMLTNNFDVDFVFHLGARTDTTEFNKAIFDELNERYSEKVWICCAQYEIPLIYASSAATYGMGEHGYKDDQDLIPMLKPLNPYGDSKNNFDNWTLSREEYPPYWAGVKFFNVYGPNEYHKARMASVVYHAYNQINEKNYMNLFRSHRSDYADGMQLRDFIYVKDVADVLFFLFKTRKNSGIYNLGTGQARAFLHLAKAVFKAMGKKEDIRFVDTPEDIRDKYQYFTEADMQKLKSLGYNREFTSLEEGVADYVKNYLLLKQFE